MRIVTLVAGSPSLDDTEALSKAIRAFNAEVDFRLRFLDIEIKEVFCAAPDDTPALSERIERAEVREIAAADALVAAASIALILNGERPDLVVCVGAGALRDPAIAAATAAEQRLGFYGAGRGAAEGALDLGEDPQVAVERMTGVAREIA
jgi:hypothetical protein